MQNKSITVVAPASSANLGPGFDALGIALSMYNEYTFTLLDKPEPIKKGKEHLSITAMRSTFKRCAQPLPPVHVEGRSGIPMTRGLGSSAACVVAGVVAANEIGNLKLTKQELLDIASDMEGHPDNVAPALLGGMIAATIDRANGGRVIMERRLPHSDAAFFALIPDYRLATKKARGLLPDKISRADAVFNISRAVLTFSALSEGGTLDNLSVAMQDRLHQPMRAPLIPGFYDMIRATQDAGALGAALSGAGPTILVIARKSDVDFLPRLQDRLSNINTKLDIVPLSVDTQGTRIIG